MARCPQVVRQIRRHSARTEVCAHVAADDDRCTELGQHRSEQQRGFFAGVGAELVVVVNTTAVNTAAQIDTDRPRRAGREQLPQTVLGRWRSRAHHDDRRRQVVREA